MLPRQRRSHTGQGQQMVVGREYTQGLGLAVTDPRSMRISNARGICPRDTSEECLLYVPQVLLEMLHLWNHCVLEMLDLLSHYVKDPEGSLPSPIRN